MTQYRSKPEIVDATRWCEDGDHPKVTRTPGSDRPCPNCGRPIGSHGALWQGNVGMLVCPGSWIVERVGGDFSVFPEDLFNASFEPVEDASEAA